MIIGATPETDRHIMDLTEGLYRKYALRQVFLLRLSAGCGGPPPAGIAPSPPLLREHRLYQADWLLRLPFFGAGAADRGGTEVTPISTPSVPGRCAARIFPGGGQHSRQGGAAAECRASALRALSASCRARRASEPRHGRAEVHRRSAGSGRSISSPAAARRFARSNRAQIARCPAGPQGVQRGDATAFAG